MTCAPCAAASLISSDAFSIFSFTSLPQPICMAATVVFLISCSSHPPGISRYLLCNTMNVPTTDNNITCVNRVYFPSGKKPPYDVHSLCIHFILKLGNQDSSICNIKINIACGKPLPCFSLLLPLFKGKTGKFIFRYTNRLPRNRDFVDYELPPPGICLFSNIARSADDKGYCGSLGSSVHASTTWPGAVNAQTLSMCPFVSSL